MLRNFMADPVVMVCCGNTVAALGWDSLPRSIASETSPKISHFQHFASGYDIDVVWLLL